MNPYLILRLTNAAIACDKRKDFALADLLTETIRELEHGNLRAEAAACAIGTRVDDQGSSDKSADGSFDDQRL